ncbi:hypothetical protein [Hymenobacter sp. BRD67]|uniref:hypothetical protein n=1 Tax=Hymenobacter sp. BRD67 TaxID=2675877 RepID=UPI0039774EC6
MFDAHVHFRAPGFENKETITTGSEAAINGGITGVVMMPNTRPASIRRPRWPPCWKMPSTGRAFRCILPAASPRTARARSWRKSRACASLG